MVQGGELNEKQKNERILAVLPHFQVDASQVAPGRRFEYRMFGSNVCFAAFCTLMCVSQKKMRKVVRRYFTENTNTYSSSIATSGSQGLRAGSEDVGSTCSTGSTNSAGSTLQQAQPGQSLVVRPLQYNSKRQRTVLFLKFLHDEVAEAVPSNEKYRQLTLFFDKKSVWDAFCG